MGTLVGEIDKALQTAFFSDIKGLSWNIQNDFTHTGRSQRIGRVTKGGTGIMDYPDEGMIPQTDCAIQVVVIFAIVLVKTLGHAPPGTRLDPLADAFISQ